MGIYDLSLKTLFDNCPEDFIRLALGGDAKLEQVQFHPTETRIVERRQDHLARVRVEFLPVWPVVYYLSEEGYPKHPKTRFESRLWNHSINTFRANLSRVQALGADPEGALHGIRIHPRRH